MPRHFLSPPFISFIFLFNPSGGPSGGPRLKPKSRPQWGRRCGEMRGPLLGVRLCSTSWQRGESVPSDICIVQPCVCIVNTCSGSCLFVQHAVSSSLPRWGMKRLMKSMSHIFMRHLRSLATSMLWKDFSECLYHRYARMRSMQWRFPSHFQGSNPPCGVFLCRDRSSWRRTPGKSRGGSLPDSTRQWLPPNAMQGDICKP